MRKIGEIFEYEGVILEVKEGRMMKCNGCYFNNSVMKCSNRNLSITGNCYSSQRDDVIFAKYTPTIIEVDEND